MYLRGMNQSNLLKANYKSSGIGKGGEEKRKKKECIARESKLNDKLKSVTRDVIGRTWSAEKMKNQTNRTRARTYSLDYYLKRRLALIDQRFRASFPYRVLFARFKSFESSLKGLDRQRVRCQQGFSFFLTQRLLCEWQTTQIAKMIPLAFPSFLVSYNKREGE